MKYFRLITLLAAISLVANPARAFTPSDASGGMVPNPPQQTAPWSGQYTAISKDVDRFFQLGGADPRGCEYKAVKIRIGKELLNAHAWVIPNTNPVYAVAWDGLIYRVESVGEPANLDNDAVFVAKSFTKPKKGSNLPEYLDFSRNFYLNYYSLPESFAIDYRPHASLTYFLGARWTPSRSQLVLLMRLGRFDVAKQALGDAFNTPDPPYSPPVGNKLTGFADQLIAELRWNLMIKAVDAHCADDRSSALAACKILDMHFKTTNFDLQKLNHRDGYSTYDYQYLQNFIPLMADEQRRMAEASNASTVVPKYVSRQDAEAGDYIKEIDNCESPIFFGTVDPPIKRLIALGDKAVEPLINAVKNDSRLTKAYMFDPRMGSSNGSNECFIIYPAAEYEEYALEQILGITPATLLNIESFNHDDFDRHKVAEAYRNYWEKNKAIPRWRRFYNQLADENGSLNSWSEAANIITQYSPKSEDYKQLKAQDSPSITKLLIKRLKASTSKNRSHYWDYTSCFQQALKKWNTHAIAKIK